VRDSATGSVLARKTGTGMKAAFLAVAVLPRLASRSIFQRSLLQPRRTASKTKGMASGAGSSAAQVPVVQKSPSTSLNSRCRCFRSEPGQTAAPVKFLARGSGYGLFLTADESGAGVAAASCRPSVVCGWLAAARSGSEFGDSDAAGGGEFVGPRFRDFAFAGQEQLFYWQRSLPVAAEHRRLGRVEYSAVYPARSGVYAIEGQLEYDFRVAPGSDPKQIALSFRALPPALTRGLLEI